MTAEYELRTDAGPALVKATATLLKQLLASLRLPDEMTGKRLQRRGGARGTYWPPPKPVG